MKKIAIFTIMVLFLSVLSNFALAAAQFSLSLSNLDFGEVDWDESSSKSITINNTGDQDLTNVTLSSTAGSEYNIAFNANNFDLAIGANKAVSVTIKPNNDPDLDGGNKTIGNLEVDSTQTSKTSIPIRVYTPERLYVKSIDAKVAGKIDSDLKEGDKIKDNAAPADSVEFTIRLENTFDSEDDEYSIENVRVRITAINIDNGEDIERESIKATIEAGASKTETLKFDVPSTVVAGKYDILVEIEGENTETGDDYNYEVNLELEVEKNKHDIIITKFELNPPALSCSFETTAHIELLNQGKDTENSAVIEIKSSDLNINERITGIDLGKDDDKDAKYSKDIVLPIEEDTLTKKYTITANVYYDNDNLDDQKTTILDFTRCNGQTETKNETKTNQTQTVNQTETITNKSERTISRMPPSVIIDEIRKSITSSKYFWPVAGLIGLGIVIIVCMFVAKAIVKKRQI